MNYADWNACLNAVLTASQKVVPPFPPNDVVEASRCRPRSWQCGSGGGGCSRRPSCRGSLSGPRVHRSFGSRGLGHSDGNHPRIPSSFFPELLHPTTRIATSNKAIKRASSKSVFNSNHGECLQFNGGVRDSGLYSFSHLKNTYGTLLEQKWCLKKSGLLFYA